MQAQDPNEPSTSGPPKRVPGSLNGNGATWPAGATFSFGGTSSLQAIPSLSQTVKHVQQQVWQHVPKDNPGVQRLVSGYELWQSSLRSEAQKRLEAPGTTVRVLASDWELLKRAPSSRDMGMKRSASDNALTALTVALRGGAHGAHGAHAHASTSGVHGLHTHGPGSHSRGIGGGSRSGINGLGIGYDFSGEAKMFGSRPGVPRAVAQDASSAAGGAPSSSSPMQRHYPSEQYLVGLGIPSIPAVPSASDLSELSDTWHKAEAETQRNLETFLANSRRAMLNAQERIQETASNCQQNLQMLSRSMKTTSPQNLQATARLLQASPSDASASESAEGQNDQASPSSPPRPPWSGLATSSDPFSGALVPWSVFPRHQRPRESEGDAEASDWTAPFDQFLQALDANIGTQLQLTAAPHAAEEQQGGGATAGWGAAARGAGKQSQAGRSVRDPGRKVAIVTTASLPWLTGTSVNPLLRAAYLSNDETRNVTLCLPWLTRSDQERLFPPNAPRFDTPEAQENFVREWARSRTGLTCNFRISFYPGRYSEAKGSILPVGDITSIIPDNEADVAVLEEPEHLNWFHHGRRWTDKFNHVVGVMHTNYLDYARREEGGAMKEMLMHHINAWVCRVHCHKVIKLSDAVQNLPRQETMFIHGVSPHFLKVGEEKAVRAREGDPSGAWGKGVYYIGKVLWAKGYTELLDRMDEHTKRTGENVPVDVYGTGPDMGEVETLARRRRLNLKFEGSRDHADASIQDYKVFVNPSLSDVVATTTAEALAMGKFVVCADHPSNRFFSRFPNCLIYKDDTEFSTCLSKALSTAPKPLSPDELQALTWEAATERFLDVADTQPKWHQPLEAALDNVLAAAHNTITGIEFMRRLVGAGPGTRDSPSSLASFVPLPDDDLEIFYKPRGVEAGAKAKAVPKVVGAERGRTHPTRPRARRSTGDRSSGEQPAKEQPAEEQPAEKQPAHGGEGAAGAAAGVAAGAAAGISSAIDAAAGVASVGAAGVASMGAAEVASVGAAGVASVGSK